MWTSTVELDPKRVLLTQVLGRFWRGAYFASFAPLHVQNVPREALPTTSWVRVRNHLAGISGSDLHLVYGNGDFRVAPATLSARSPLYPGSEAVGEVIEIGDDVQQLHLGDRVVLQFRQNCLSSGTQPFCRSCANGNYNLCENGNLPGPYPLGSGWSEEMLLHEQQLFRVPSALSDEQAVLLEPTAVALHAVLRALPQPGDRVLIIGAGTIGLLTLQILRLLVPQSEISVLARHPFQIEQATRMGAAHIIYPQDSYVSVQRATSARLYNGAMGNRMLLGGYDTIFDTVGSKSTLHHALRWTRANGTLMLIGQSPHMMHIDLTPIWHQELHLLGSFGGGSSLQWPIGSQQRSSSFSIAAELIERGQLHPEQLITHHFALNDYRLALTTASEKAQSRAIKVLFDYSLLPPSVVPNVRASLRQPRTNTTEQHPLVLPTPAPSAEAAPTRSRQFSHIDQDAWQPLLETSYARNLPTTPAPLEPQKEASAAGSVQPPRRLHPIEAREDGEHPEDTTPAMPAVGRVTREFVATPSILEVEDHMQEPDAVDTPSPAPDQAATFSEIQPEPDTVTGVAPEYMPGEHELAPEDALIQQPESVKHPEEAPSAIQQLPVSLEEAEAAQHVVAAEPEAAFGAEEAAKAASPVVEQQEIREQPEVEAQQLPPDIAAEQEAAPADALELPEDVSEPTPWTWLSYLDPDQGATEAMPKVTEIAQNQTQTVTEYVPDALLQIEDSQDVALSERAPRPQTRKRGRKAASQDQTPG